MKPCRRNRKHITWLALGALNAQASQGLRAHIEQCAGCREYLDEISRVTHRLSGRDSLPQVQASDEFHERLLNTLRVDQTEWLPVLQPARAIKQRLRMGLSLVGAAAAVLLLVSIFWRHAATPRPSPLPVLADASSSKSGDLAPTVSNYQMVANQSLEKLDELLTRQANRHHAPGSVYTASTLPSSTQQE